MNVQWETALGWQKLALNWSRLFPEARNLTIPTGRQTGKTVLARRLAVELATTSPEKAAGILGDAVDYYVTPTYPLGRKPFRLISAVCKRFNLGDVNKGERLIDFRWGSQLQFRTAVEPGDIVGETIATYMVKDEAGRMPGEAWDYSEPMMRRNRALAIDIGTPRGRSTPFYERYLRGLDEDGQSPLIQAARRLSGSDVTVKPPVDPAFLSMRVPSWVAPWWTPEAVAEARAVMSERMFRQEITADFLEGGAALFDGFADLCVTTATGPIPGAAYVIGADLGKRQDFTSVRVFRIGAGDGALAHEIRAARFQGDWHTQKMKIVGLAREYGNATVCIDATGLGDPVCDELERLGLNLHRFTFTARSKQQLIDNLVAKISTRQVRLLAKDQDPVGYQEMADFEYELVVPKGRSVIDGETVRYGHAPGKHDDTVIARALAIWGLSNVVVGIPFE